MISNLLFTNRNLEKALDASWLRNEVISQNIANSDTPGYKRKEDHSEANQSSRVAISELWKTLLNLPIGATEIMWTWRMKWPCFPLTACVTLH